ncbi:T9SS type A sorting domain-containing protein [Dokdonia sp. Hel_I_53]|uniref:T9SS type A sorting domain-containing protein n=1 Tax=Dokdonia sp. Hel_I_53 TaxID=1566287 RepID=UPI00119B3286|nr:T9SS type A sorting domain-containing protein [Dokdonia sp. Hel_I_53]TVZ51397.1 putative secreted protein (Por secretion system target) [Dokdonia sp. Hel_I_53]
MKNYSPTKVILWLCASILLCNVTLYGQQIIDTSINVNGVNRQYRLYVPQSYNASAPVPLILNFHGFTNNISTQYNQSDFTQLAEANQFIFVTPQGLGGFFSGWAINNSFGGNNDDLGFTDALIDKIKEEYSINDKRIYATGFSNGGFFSYRLACELSNRIAAVASVAGSMTRSWITTNQCQPQHPTAVLQITGTNDNVISINGNATNEPIRGVMEYWSASNNGAINPDIIDLGSGSTRSIWRNGDNGVTAEFIKVQGKGHSWNGGNVNTSQEVWNFFSRFDIDGEINSTPPVETDCITTVGTFPYAESFETNFGQWTNTSTGDDINWSRDSSGTPSSQTGPSTAVDGNVYLYVEASGNGTGFPNKKAILNSPCLDFTNLNEPSLSFQSHMYGSTINNLIVEVRTNNEGNWTTVFSKSGNQGNAWVQESIDLSIYAGISSVQLRYIATTGNGTSGWQSDIAIDAISIQNGLDDTDPPGCATLNFNDFAIASFSNQDAAGTFSTGNNGASLSLTNNTWKTIALDYNITSQTVLEFDFSSSSEGEIHGIGFETNNTLTSSRYFKVHGTQNYGVTNYNTYAGGTTTYVIPVGSFYTGPANQLVFINDNDGGFGNTSTFSNVKIYEGSCGSTRMAIRARTEVVAAVIGTEDEVNSAMVSVYPNPTRNQFSIAIPLESSKTATVRIYNTLGQEVYKGILQPGNTLLNTQEIKMSAGMYVLEINLEKNISRHKLIVN